MFLLISWRWVKNVVAVIATTRQAAMICTVMLPPESRKVEEILPPNSSASRSSCAWPSESSPRPCPFLAAWSIIRNSAMKIGIWMISGRQEANGLVLVSR